MSFKTKTLPESFRRCMQKEPAKPERESGLPKVGAEFEGLEKKLHMDAVKWLKSEGIKPLFSQLGLKSTYTPGCPDLIISVDGRAVAIELKVKGGRLSQDQIECQEEMRANDWLIGICYSVDAVKDFVNAIRMEASS